MEQTMAMWSSQPLRILNALRVLIRVIWFIWIVTLRLIRLICLLYWDLLRLLWTLVTWWIRSGALRGVKIPRFVLHLSCLFCMRILLVFSRSRRRDIWILDTAVRRLQVIMDLNSLEMAVLREALDLCPPGHTLHILCLDILGPALWNRFHQRGDLELLAEAVELHRQTLDLFPQGHPNHSSCLSNLAAALQGRFEQLGDLDSLAEAVELHRQALNWFPQEHPDRSSSLNNLANALRSQFEQLGDLDSLAEAVELHRQALTLRPPGHPYRSSSLNNLALALQTRFDQMGDLDVLAEAVDLHRQALTLRPQEHPHRSSSLNNLANALQSRFEQLGDRDSLAEAVKLHRQAMILRPHGHPDRSSSLNNLANALQTRFEQLGDLDSLVEAVELHRQAMVLRPQGHPDRSSSLNNLANALQTRFEQLGDLDSLAEAVELHRQALDLFLQGHSNRPSSLSNLAGALQIGFAQLGDLDSLAEAVELHRQAMILRPQGHPDRSSSLNILANALQTRFEQLGDLDSLAEAVELHRQALDLLPPGHSNRPSSLSNLAVALKIRFEQLGDLDSLAEAVGLHRQALDLFLQGHPNRSSSLSNLAAALHNRFQELGEIDSLAEAIELHCQALILRPQGHPDRALSLNNLAIVLQTRFEQLGDLNSLGEAVELHRQALHLRPQGHPGRSSSLNNLARALHTQFQLLDSISDGFEIDLSPHRGLDLEEDLGLLKEGLQSCADGHPMRINFLFHSSHCMLRTGSHAFNFAEAIRHILEALQHGASPARQSLRHSINALRAVEAAYQVLPQPLSETDIGKHRYDDLVLDIYRQTIRLLPRAASFGLDHAGRLRELSSAEAVTRNAATRAITAGRENEAVEMLEEGRGLFWSQALRLRTTDLDLLPVQDAQELRRLFRLLDIRSIGDESTTTPQRERLVEQRRRLSTSAEALISDIRSRPDMSRFLLPPAFSSLMQSLPEGFVVFLNVSELGHHALILNGYAKSVHNLPLTLPARILGTTRKAVNHKSSHARDNDDGLAAQDSVQSVAEQFRAGIREHATFGDSLADLWVYIVKPIINLLQLKKSSGRNRPRVWWCATGMLTFLPIHAAGGYTKPARERSGAGDDRASDYIVSSYITSISALLRARNGSNSMARSDVKGLLLHEGSPGRGWSSIGNVKHEVSRVQEHFNAAGASLTVARPNLPDALTHLKETHMHILHLACHGAQKNDPITSGFILRDEDLTIQEIMQLDLKHASLAFLSACQTAKGKRDQPDEGVHLAASMLFCGFKSVIATMWGMSDKDGPIVADHVYDVLFKEAVFDLNVVPYALDDAVRRLREQNVEAERWSVFVHLGA